MHITATFEPEFDQLYSNIDQQYLDLDGISLRKIDVGQMSHDYFTEKLSDITIDANANANENKSPNNYMAEITKGILKLEGYYLLWRYAKKRFGIERANELLESIWKGDLYFHDASGPGIQMPYSYIGDTSIFVKINGNIYYMSLDALFARYKDNVKVYPDREVINDFTVKSKSKNGTVIVEEREHLQVYNGKTWVDIKQIQRHKRHNNFLAITTEDGRVTVVTEDHPVILHDGTIKQTSQVSVGDKLLIADNSIPLQENVWIEPKFAYLMGLILADGYKGHYRFMITQKDEEVKRRLIEYLNDLEIKSRVYKDRPDRFDIGSKDITAIFKMFGLEGNAFTKRVPIDVFSWNRESIIAFICGLFDGEGNLNHTALCIRISNFAIASALAELLRSLKSEFVSLRARECKKSRNGFKSNTNLLYIITFVPSETDLSIFKKYSVKLANYYYTYSNSKFRNKFNSGVVVSINVLKTQLCYFDYAYDITVEGSIFYSNSLIQHNCLAYSTTPIMLDGRPYGQLHSLPPKRADSFMAQVIETTMDLSQEFVGAISPADLLVNYAYYAKKDNLSDYEIVNDFQKFVHVVNNAFRVGQSPFTNISLFDKPNLETVFEYYVYPDGSRPDFDYIMHIQKLVGEWFAKGDPATGVAYRFPIVTCNLMVKEGETLDKDFLEWVARNNIKRACFNIYINDGYKIATCCRLSNNIQEMRKKRADTFGNGGINIGSTRVVTVNLPRLARTASGNQKLFFELLNDTVTKAKDLLIIHREEILNRRIEQGFLKFFKPLGWFNLEMFFNTIGVVGIYEMTKFMGLDILTTEGQQFVKDVLTTLDSYADKFSEETGWAFNVEEIPAEQTAVVLAKKDKLYFGDNPFELYSNQYIPLIEDVDLATRMVVSGKFLELTSGGGILHLNIEDQIKNPAQMKKLIENCVKAGVTHFAINYGYIMCNDCKQTTIGGNKPACLKCGSKNVDYLTRVIGYYSKVSAWNPVRREYEFPRRIFK